MPKPPMSKSSRFCIGKTIEAVDIVDSRIVFHFSDGTNFEIGTTTVHESHGNYLRPVLDFKFDALNMPLHIPPTAESEPRGEVVVTKNSRGVIILVSRQDEDHKILSIIAEPGLTPEQEAANREVDQLLTEFKK